MFNLIPWKKKNKEKSNELVQHHGRPLASLRDEVDSLFDRFLARWSAPFRDEFGLGKFPALDVEDNDQEVVIKAEVPGFESGELDVQVSGNLLTVKAERKDEKNGNGGNGHYHEHRTFRQSVTLPPGTEPDKIEALYKNGLLHVHVPKSEKARGTRIPVRA